MSTSLISGDGNDAPNPIERVLQKRGIGEVEEMNDFLAFVCKFLFKTTNFRSKIVFPTKKNIKFTAHFF